MITHHDAINAKFLNFTILIKPPKWVQAMLYVQGYKINKDVGDPLA
jgi:hypothetical protein